MPSFALQRQKTKVRHLRPSGVDAKEFILFHREMATKAACATRSYMTVPGGSNRLNFGLSTMLL